MTIWDWRERIEKFLDDIWAQEKTGLIDSYIGKAYTIHNDPGDPWHGKTLNRVDYQDRLITSRSSFPDQVFSLVEASIVENRVAIFWRWEGTHLAPLNDIPATGKRIHMTGATLYDTDGDKLTGHWQIADRLGVYQQLMAATGT